MNWYSAHIIMYVELKDRVQRRYPVWENIVLIKARDADVAFEKAERCGRSEEGDSEGSFRWGKHPRGGSSPAFANLPSVSILRKGPQTEPRSHTPSWNLTRSTPCGNWQAESQ